MQHNNSWHRSWPLLVVGTDDSPDNLASHSQTGRFLYKKRPAAVAVASVLWTRGIHRHVASAATEPVRLVALAPAFLVQPAEAAGRVARRRHVLAHRIQVNCRGHSDGSKSKVSQLK